MFNIHNISRLSLVILAGSLSGCAGLGTALSATGGVASIANAYWTYEQRQSTTVISKECLWYRKIKLSEASKENMTLEDKKQLARLNLTYQEVCLGK